MEKSGAWYNYKALRLGQGRENSKQFLSENKDLAREVREAVLSAKGLVEQKITSTAAAADPGGDGAA